MNNLDVSGLLTTYSMKCAVSNAREDYKRQKNLCFESMVRSKFRNM